LKDVDPAPDDDSSPPAPPKKPRKINPEKQSGAAPSPDVDPDSELRGRTLRAYLFILKSPKAVGVRELQRSLGLSSPSVAYHHLDKLTRLGLIEKDQYGEYTIVKNANVNVLQAFTQVGRLLVPRFIFYAVFFTTLLVGYILVFEGRVNFFAIAFGLFAGIFAWYEAYRTWKRRPF
jgi:DNA-binding transcriptional ArsR family regulator